MTEEKQYVAPLFQVLQQHQNVTQGNFHVPGHKQGKVFDDKAASFFGDLLPLDLTEVGELDDLHQPVGAIDQAQQLAAEAFDADRTFFLVGGSTSGNLALILSCCRPGERLIVHRSSHQSVFHGCILAGARPVFISGRGEIPQGGRLEAEDLRYALRRYPDVKGVFITSPDYFGRLQPVAELAEMCHRFGVPLLVDEAHGAHFGFHPSLPRRSIALGADAAVQSTHKMLPAMTMASMLHLRGNRVDPDRVGHWLRVVQSSSPSYPLMASLDLARRLMAVQGTSLLEQALERATLIRQGISTLIHLREEFIPGNDPLKLNIRARRKISGYRLQEGLERRGLFMEMADHEKVLAVLTPGTSPLEGERMVEALAEWDQAVGKMEEDEPVPMPSIPPVMESEVSLDRLRTLPESVVALTDAEGKIATRMVTPYPPGVPLLLPGERVGRQQLDRILHILRHGGRVRGLLAGSPQKMYVIK